MTVSDVLSNKLDCYVTQGEALAFMRGLPDASVDALICDPPYSSGGQFRGDRAQSTTTKYVTSGAKNKGTGFTGDNRDQRSFFAWCTLWLSEALRVCKDGAPFVVFTDWRQYPVLSDAVQAGGWIWRGAVSWDKTEGCARPVLGRFRSQTEHALWGNKLPEFEEQAEYALWGSNGPMPTTRNAPVLPGAYRVAIPSSERHHQTPKPEALLRQIVRICEPGGVILDPFMGSGSCGVAAISEGYRYLGCDLSAEFAAISKERMREALALR